MSPKLCHSFQQGHCRFGAKCRFYHGSLAAKVDTEAVNSSPRVETELEKACKKWTYMIPKPNSNSRFQVAVDTKTFFKIGWSLVKSDDAGTRQYVITKLGAETGLSIIKSLTDTIDINQREDIALLSFRERILPFYRIISHPDVLSSLILEAPIDVIYTFLFGPSGRRGLKVFRATATALCEMIVGNLIEDERISTIAITSSLAVLDRLIEINQSAHVNEEFSSIVETISACIPDDFAVPEGRLNLTRIKRRLKMGTSLPFVPARIISRDIPSATFELSQDLPGHLSSFGIRHDNDHASIVNIQILPTAQEIVSVRQEYLPLIDTSRHHLSGLAGLLDRQFRLLREDTVGQLRDAVREEIMRLKQPDRSSLSTQGQQGVRKVVYHNIRFSHMIMDRRKGFQVVAEFDQPLQASKKSLKSLEDWWKGSKLLQPDSLVCFVSANGRTMFLCVCDPAPSQGRRDSIQDHSKESSFTASLFRNKTRASVLLTLADNNMEDALWICTHPEPSQVRQSLVEFPGVLLPSFGPTLEALQSMSKKLSVPFAHIIAPDSPSTAASVEQPVYTKKRGFKFDLSNLVGVPLALEPGKLFDFSKLNEASSLDEAQQIAVVQALSTELALIQGPPGTGKSYTGVAIIKTLLSNRKTANLGPIVCVCYTNHALDQLLEHLVQSGVTQVIRLGSRSKSELLQNLTLRRVAEELTPTKTEKHDRWVHNQTIAKIVQDIQNTLFGLNDPKSWTNIKAHLARTNNRHLSELFGNMADNEGFMEVKGKRFSVVNSWLRGASPMLVSTRPIDVLLSISLKEMSKSERCNLHKYWMKERSIQLTNDLSHELDLYRESKSALDKCHKELDLRCLREAHIIGVTTSGLARNIEILQRVHAKVMLCEEAGEVLEAHTLTAFLPGVEHAILIGDHEQLRPQINNYEFQRDNSRGQKYSLDISLFERLVRPQAGDPRVPLNTLKTQRRMHPSVSELVRVPLYPDLQDHFSVSDYPEVDGMRYRLYWLDHQEEEDPRPTQAVSMSKTNTFEVEMAAALVSHLVRQGTYKSEDIAIITPYLGQLQKIRKRLATSFEIVVGDRDQEDLEAQGLEDDPQSMINGRPQVQKTTLLNALRIATVDNFQGEEAKVIVVSLVRSNEKRKCGFLKTSNRINVLLSRARHGMYIIGNSDTSRPVPMWAKVLSILERSENIGPSLALCCPRHKETPIQVSTPDDFSRFAPEGGCARRCVSRLSCGHSCPNMCHSVSLHNSVRCLERCQRPKTGCEHSCPRPCGDQCESECQFMLFNIVLPCGHVAEKIRCYEAQSPKKFQCQMMVKQIMSGCKHGVQVPCYQLPLGGNYPCSATCGAILKCGHSCTNPCKTCSPRVEGAIETTLHGGCKTVCGRPYTTCSHSCETPCHGSMPCSPCTQPCEVSCHHSKCGKLCHEPCAPCAEDCAWSCPHHGRCPLPCAVPCDRLPCSIRCSRTLGCGHQCPSICGEDCPDVTSCQICATATIKDMVVDFIMSDTFAEIDLDERPCIVPTCGHILTLESMDGHMSMSDFYEMNTEGSIVKLKNIAEPFSAAGMKSCPTCRGPLRNINRYGHIVRRALIDEATKRFIVWANMQFVPLAKKMQAAEASLRETDIVQKKKDDAQIPSTSLPEPLLLAGTRDQQLNLIKTLTRSKGRYKAILNLRRDIKKFLLQVNEREQPFGRIYDLVQDARRHRGVDSNLTSNSGILQVRNRLLSTVLLIRCDYTIILTFLDDWKRDGKSTSNSIRIDMSINRKECEKLIEESRSKDQPGNQVEGCLYWARFYALERSLTNPESEQISLLEKARGYLRLANTLCHDYPGQTAGMSSEIEDTEKMMRDSTFYLPVSNEEKAAVFAAMAQDFRGTGHWYYCANGHPFTIGECGMPMETSKCPQCGSAVGGRNHESVGGVTRATDMELAFSRLVI